MPCSFCNNAYVDDSLNFDNDLSYFTVGSFDKKYFCHFRSGDKRPTCLEFSFENKLIGFYIPKFCPNCGRKLFENEKKADD